MTKGMMAFMNEEGSISSFGVFSTIVVSVIGVGIFGFPRNAAKIVGSDGWITAIMGGIISYVLLYVIYLVVKDNEYDDFCSIYEKNFGKFLGKAGALFFAAYIVFSITIGLRAFIEVIKMYLLPKTPTEFLTAVTIITAFYIVRGGIEAVVKFNEVSFWVMFIPMGIVILFMLNGADFSNLFPVMTHSLKEYIKSLKIAVYSFSGFETAYLVLPLADHRKSIKKSLSRSILFIILFYIIIFVFTIAVLCKEQTKILLWPTITMIKTINIHGTFIERWDGIVMTLWIIFFFTTFANGFYFVSDIVKNIFKFPSINISSTVTVPFLYIGALLPQNIAKVYDLSLTYMPLITGINLMAVPFLMLILHFLKKRKNKR